MPEEQVKRKRGRPRKNPVAETNSQSSPTIQNESNSSEANTSTTSSTIKMKYIAY